MKITAKKLMMALIPYGFIILYRHYKNSKNANYEKAFTWIMTENEQKLFKEYIRNAKIYLEFGSGGSTIVALNSVEGKIYSVESSKDWIETIRQKYDIIENGVDRLMVCRKNPVSSDDEIMKEYENYKYNSE